MKRYVLIMLGVCVLFVGNGCEQDLPLKGPEHRPITLEVPTNYAKPLVPEDNPLTPAKIALGKKLFYDKNISRDSSVSCSSCHLADHAFSDPRQFSLGVGERIGTRNAPALVNTAYGRSFFWDGANPALETQAIFPLEASFEMDMDLAELVERLKADPEYPALFQAVFGVEPNVGSITQAIASFERSMLSLNSPYDRYLQGDESALNESEKRGLTLFFGEKAECFHCHVGTNFSDELFHNNGLYETYLDNGRWEVTGLEEDRSKFKTPTLRNIAYTAPYMHDGSIETLEEVVEHYSSGGASHPNKSGLIRAFTLSNQEKEDLLNFLHALSDTSFIYNPAFRE